MPKLLIYSLFKININRHATTEEQIFWLRATFKALRASTRELRMLTLMDWRCQKFCQHSDKPTMNHCISQHKKVAGVAHICAQIRSCCWIFSYVHSAHLIRLTQILGAVFRIYICTLRQAPIAILLRSAWFNAIHSWITTEDNNWNSSYDDLTNQNKLEVSCNFWARWWQPMRIKLLPLSWVADPRRWSQWSKLNY